MYKIYLALGHKELEAYLKSKEKDINLIAQKLGTIKDTIRFEGNTSYKEGVLNGLKDVRPNLLIIREKLSGTISITDLIYQIRLENPTLRIIFLAGDRVPGDAFLASLVTYNIYDIIVGNEIQANKILDRIVSPNTFANVAHLVPKTNIDEKTGQKLYEAPNVVPIINNIKIEGITESNQTPTPTSRKINVDSVKNKAETENVDTQHLVKRDEGVTSSTKEKDNDYYKNYEHKNTTIKDEEIIIDDLDDDIVIEEDEEIDVYNNEESSNHNNVVKETVANNINPKIDLNLEKDNSNKSSILPLPIHKKGKITLKEKEPVNEVEENVLNIKTSNQPLKVSQKVNPANNYQNNNDDFFRNKERKVLKTPTPSEKERAGLFGKILGSKKDVNKKIGQRIITFIGGSSGVGTSQLAFNTALELAKDGYKVMYMDLNQLRSSIESIFQLGYSDVGIDTALKGIEENNFELVDKSIVTMDKILYLEENNPSPLYKTYSKLPKNLDYLFFSQDHIKKVLVNSPIDINANMLKDLNMYLLMQEGYDFIILDAPSNMGDKLTEIATIFSMKLFFVITQDISTITNNINCQLKLLDEKRINYREKCYYILNKTENASWNYTKIYRWLVESTQIDRLDMVSVPYIQRDFIMANYEGTPISWLSNSKELKKAFSEISKLILS